MSPAIPALPRSARQPTELRALLGKQGLFERGDKIYLQTPVQRFRPTRDQIEELAFCEAIGGIRDQAPNENLVWFRGQYVEADNPNLNGAQWRGEELAIKSLTPMLMPVTVMHDPRTAVGTIADTKHLTPEKDNVSRPRIDTVLALWAHRFPEAVREAEVNADQGTLMQSMECYSPWYECSECSQVFHKLPEGAERAMWCEHLQASNPSGGTTDWNGGPRTNSNASRILGDVCFTGTGLIFGTRGATGAYPDAFLNDFEDEVAAFHQNVHSSTVTTSRSAHMGQVTIEQSELDLLRKERDDARAETVVEKEARQTAERAAEAAETAKVAAEAERDTAKTELTAKNEELAKAGLKSERMKALGDGFTAKLGDFTKGRLDTQAGTMSDEDWDDRLKELEEQTGVKRDETTDGSTKPPVDAAAATTFSRDEIASFGGNGNGDVKEPTVQERSNVVGSLAAAFKK